MSFSVTPGETVALVGGSGGGKTTLVNLLPRFYAPEPGRILLDGHDLQSLTLESLRANLALVSQDVVLFNDIDARQHRLWRAWARPSEPQVIAAAEAAHAMEFIRDMPQGLDTLIGENGMRLSGGQRQRLAIARALLKNAPVLILDEATSALDSESERLVQAGARDADARPHHARHRAPPVHHRARRPHRGAGARPHRRIRHACRVAGEGRHLREAVPDPVRGRSAQGMNLPRTAETAPFRGRLAGRLRVVPRALAQRFLSMRRRERPLAPRRILIAHHLLAGDVLMLTPLLAKLRERHPGAEIVLAMRRSIVPLYSGRPYGTQALAYDPKDAASLDVFFDGPGFDLAIVPGDNRYSWLAAAAGARWIVAFGGDRPAAKSWPADELRPYRAEPAAWGDMVADLADGPAPRAYRPSDWPAPACAPFDAPGGRYAVLHVEASTTLKHWEDAKWLALADWLSANGVQPVWSAGPAGADIAEAHRSWRTLPGARAPHGPRATVEPGRRRRVAGLPGYQRHAHRPAHRHAHRGVVRAKFGAAVRRGRILARHALPRGDGGGFPLPRPEPPVQARESHGSGAASARSRNALRRAACTPSVSTEVTRAAADLLR